jgi:hypothetical protein
MAAPLLITTTLLPGGSAVPGRRSSGCSRCRRAGQAQSGPHDTCRGSAKLGLLRQRAPPAGGQPVIVAQPTIVRFLPVGLDQPFGGEPVQHPVQAADLQLDPALRQLGDLPTMPYPCRGSSASAVSTKNACPVMACQPCPQYTGNQDMSPRPAPDSEGAGTQRASRSERDVLNVADDPASVRGIPYGHLRTSRSLRAGLVSEPAARWRGDGIVVIHHVHGRLAGGTLRDATAADVFTIGDGLIVQMQAYADPPQMLAADSPTAHAQARPGPAAGEAAESKRQRYLTGMTRSSRPWRRRRATTVAVEDGLICGFATTGPTRDPDTNATANARFLNFTADHELSSQAR